MKHNKFATLIALAGVLALMAACSTGGDGRAELRKLAGAETPRPTAQRSIPTPQPAQIIEVTRIAPAQVVEVTRVVEVQQPPQVVEVTRVVVVEVTPEITGFDMPAVDESVQPCPRKFWKRGRCTATQQQIEQAAEVQP